MVISLSDVSKRSQQSVTHGRPEKKKVSKKIPNGSNNLESSENPESVVMKSSEKLLKVLKAQILRDVQLLQKLLKIYPRSVRKPPTASRTVEGGGGGTFRDLDPRAAPRKTRKLR